MADNKRVITDARRRQQREAASRYYARNKKRLATEKRERYHNDPDFRKTVLSRNLEYNNTHLGVRKAYTYRWKFGHVRERPEFCETCGEKSNDGRSLHFDHDHVVLNFRGWICRSCNLVLGFVNDDPKRLDALAAYLRSFGHE